MDRIITTLLVVSVFVCGNVTGNYADETSMRRTVIDLTYPLNNKTVYHPIFFNMEFSVWGQEMVDMGPDSQKASYISYAYKLPEHFGTHMDAPKHFTFDPNAWSVDEIPVDRLIVEAVVINISERAATDPDTGVTVDDLIKWEENYGRIKDGSMVIMNSGWGKYWGNEAMYLGNDRRDPSDFHYPAFFGEAAEWLVTNRNIYGVATDTMALDRGASPYNIAHTWFLSNQIYGIENIHNVAKLPPSGARLYVCPIKLEGGSGGQVRILAEIGREVEPPIWSRGCYVSGVSFWQMSVGLLAVIMNIVLSGL